MEGQDRYLWLLPSHLRSLFTEANLNAERLQEIRIRVSRPLTICYDGVEYGISGTGELCDAWEGYPMAAADVKETLEQLTGYSVYAYDQEIKQGFLTVEGGHRAGIVGKVICEGGEVQCIRYVSGLNIRLAHQRKGCAEQILPYLIGKESIYHTLILSPPGGGKTTILRDLIRLIANGTEMLSGQNVGVVDERSELAGSYRGEAQNDLGFRCDVLDGCPKAEGMMMLLRSMAPQVIAVDELGSERDRYAVKQVFYCGCRLLATAHGTSLEDLRRNPLLKELVEECMFERYIILDGRMHPGCVCKILDGAEKLLFDAAGERGDQAG